QNLGSYTRQLGRNFNVEVRDLLGRSFQDIAVQDCIDDTTGIANGDTFSSSVPSCINQVSFRAALLHSLNQFLSIFGRMQFQERLSKACGEGRSRLSDSTLGTSQFCCESGQEVVL